MNGILGMTEVVLESELSAQQREQLGLVKSCAESLMKGDPTRLRQVLINPLSNGVKFTHQGSVTLGLNCRRERHGNVEVRFLVQHGNRNFQTKPPEDFRGVSTVGQFSDERIRGDRVRALDLAAASERHGKRDRG